MILLPAIDIKGGKVVRLFQGKFSEMTEYGDFPGHVAQKWEAMGAQWLHLVDLDGAQTGEMKNASAFVSIIQKVSIPVEIGGGIRSYETIEQLISIGAARVILGTKAIEDKEFLKRAIGEFGEKVCVSLDCSNGFVAQRGWVSTTNIKATDLILELEKMGLQWVVYTDIARDGTLAGPNIEQLQTILDTVNEVNIIASGGVSSVEDVVKLKAMRSENGLNQLWGAITGKAIYEGKLDFKEAINLLS